MSKTTVIVEDELKELGKIEQTIYGKQVYVESVRFRECRSLLFVLIVRPMLTSTSFWAMEN